VAVPSSSGRTDGGLVRVDPGSVVHQQEQQAPTGRFTTPQDVADLIVFLASERAGNVTGEDSLIDGGLISTL
jgi:NAD(P)-dependent dehydrogenase (short-subunit alcohol dehydrogenase family)